MLGAINTPHDHSVLPYSRPDTPHAHQQVGFVGLGAMGYLMARNLAKARASRVPGDPPLLVWNRTLSKSEMLLSEIGEADIRIAQSPAEVAALCDVIVTNLANDEAVKEIYQQFADSNWLRQSINYSSKRVLYVTTILHCITTSLKISDEIYPKLAGELDGLISRIPRCHLITCPVFGAPAAAAKAELILCMSGDYRSKKEAAFTLVPAVGRKVIDLGENLEKAPTLKLVGNSLLLGCLEIVAESYTLAEKSGIAAKDVQHIVREFMGSQVLNTYGEKMANDLFDGKKGFSIDGGIKDATHIRRLTSEHNCPMPAVDVAHQHLLTSRALHAAHKIKDVSAKDKGVLSSEFEVLDWSAIIAASRVSAGLEGFSSGKHGNVVRED